MKTQAINYRSTRISINLVIVGVWILFFHEILQSFGKIEMTVAYVGYIILFAALFLELMNGAMSLLQNKYRVWVVAILSFGVIAFIYGLARSNSLQFLSRDLWPYSYFACFFVAARSDGWRTIDRMICWQFMIGLAVFLYILLTIDIASFTRQFISQNLNEWSGPRIYWAWGLLYGWQYMFLRFRKDLPIYQKIVTILGVASFIIFGVIMLKRQVIVELIMLCVSKLIYSMIIEKTSVSKWIISFIIILVAAYSGISYYKNKYNIDYIKDLTERSTEQGSISETTMSNTRLIDQPRYVYDEASSFEVFFGQGLGSGVFKDGKEIVNTLESGLVTTFMKGGILYIIVWYAGFFLILRDTVLLKRKDNLIFGLLSSIFIISSPMGPFFFDYFSTGYKMLWLGRATTRMRGEEVFETSKISLGLDAANPPAKIETSHANV